VEFILLKMKIIRIKSCNDCKFNTNNIQEEIDSVVEIHNTDDNCNLFIEYNTCLIGDFEINTGKYNYSIPRNCPLEDEIL
jgi:hypothetical protein